METEQRAPTCHCTIDGIQKLCWSTCEKEEGWQLTFSANQGLYQLSIIADANDFDWDRLYFNLNLFGNKGQKTGPWDFDLTNNNIPLVPSYWFELDGKRIGLWYFQRVSLEDMAARCFRGRTAFQISSPGEHTIRLVPFRNYDIQWISCLLEVDPEDALEPLPSSIKRNSTPDEIWPGKEFLEGLHTRLDTTHELYKEPIEKCFEWVFAKNEKSINDLVPLLFAYYLRKQNAILDEAIQLIDHEISLSDWGRPEADQYGHNGDMGAMNQFRSVTLGLLGLWNELDDTRRQKIIDKLRIQGNRFVEQALLTRDYWGGSVIQDHGWKSIFGFGSAVLLLYGIIPEAEKWCEFIIPRIRRSLDAIPRDGVIPPSSYSCIYLYTDYVTYYRDALLDLTGEDIFDTAPFQKVIDYLWTILREKDMVTISCESNSLPVKSFVGGNMFLNRIARKYIDSKAAFLQRLSLRQMMDSFYHGTRELAYYHGFLWGFYSYQPMDLPEVKPISETPLNFWEDSGLIFYHDQKSDITFSTKCGPFSGYNAYHKAKGPCDRLMSAPGAGHFIITLGKVPILTTPDTGYKLTAKLQTCMLIDDKGAYGDIGYPMSIPSFTYRGEEVELMNWNDQKRNGYVRLDLAPAYKNIPDLLCYTREFILIEGEKIICREQVVLSEPHQLSWLFQTSEEEGITHKDQLDYRFGKDRTLMISPSWDGDLELKASINDTPVVWSYASASGFSSFKYLRYDTIQKTKSVTIDFEMTFY